MTTIIQTAEIQMNDIINRFHTIDLRPQVGSYDVKEYPDYLIKNTDEGVRIVFYNKPTIADAVNTRGNGNYYQFHKNGTVVARYKGNEQSHFWSSPIPDNNSSYSYFT